MLIFFTLVCTVGSFVEAMGDDLCPYKECTCVDVEILCEQLGLRMMPTLQHETTSGYTELVLDTNRITSVPSGSLPLNLTEISFTNNPITSIDDDSFRGSSWTLYTLTFQGAAFSKIPDALLQLNDLKYLNIFDTGILDWNVAVMQKIGFSVQMLDLRNVSLKSWPAWLQNFTQLTELNIIDSDISFVPDDAFDLMTSTLTSLTINNSSLTSVPVAMAKLSLLESLDLDHNNIINISAVRSLRQLSTLSLGYNHISDSQQVTAAFQPFADSIIVVELSNNQLRGIPDLSLLSRVTGLDFSHNRISDPWSGSLASGLYDLDLGYNLLPSVPFVVSESSSLVTVTLQHNLISSLQATDFNPSIFNIILGYNLITHLTDHSFPDDSHVRSLYLNNNPLVVISPQALVTLPRLAILDLSGTNLSRLPLQLTSLPPLDTLSLVDCPHLVCTCSEAGLRAWILSAREVTGTCGQTSVYYFYRNLSQGCPTYPVSTK